MVRDAAKTPLLTMTKNFAAQKKFVILMSPKGVSKDAHGLCSACENGGTPALHLGGLAKRHTKLHFPCQGDAPTMSDPALEAHEHAEHAEHAAHENNPFVSLVSITIALLAVIAAVTGSLESIEDGSAIIEANKAVLAQDQASDQWAYYQSKSLKQKMYSIAADAGGTHASDYAKTAKKEGDEAKDVQTGARKLEAERDKLLEESRAHEERHHRLSLGATLLEIGIAIATIAIITRHRLTWLLSALLGVAGGAVAGATYATDLLHLFTKTH